MAESTYPAHLFPNVPLQAEWPESYKIGGFHPISLNDTFNDCYVVFRKLGHDGVSTSWLAVDKRTNRYVTLRIFKADNSKTKSFEETFTPETSLQNHPGAKHLAAKINSFSFDGPNGNHTCIVSEPLGREYREVIYNQNYSSQFRREVCRQFVQAIDYLHSQRIMHRSFDSTKIRFELTYDLNTLKTNEIQKDAWSDEDVQGDQDSMTADDWAAMNFRRQANWMNILERSDGLPLSKHHPAYTILASPLDDGLKPNLKALQNFSIKLTNLSSACKFKDCNDGTKPYEIETRAPEVILQQPYNENADIWALATVLYEMVTGGTNMLGAMRRLDEEQQDDDHMIFLIERFGKLPDFIRSKWTRANEFLDDVGNILNPDEGGASCQQGDLLQGVMENKPEDMSDAEALAFHGLLMKMLDFEPILNDQERILKTSDDEDVAKRLLKLLPSIFPPSSSTLEPSIFFYDDLSMRNILIDDDGKITGAVDWKCASALPLW
ncbi:hypothetical protein G7Y89_g6268 [Cudoniella acicularis]|uniref:non-specific serine/threonine protein kinase n=1 Tax=Cudoniella acicularis TaxID=354080 RepID=A0A8H4RN23_9HELO|nr:hypothetical protein G7Y89_g6268 [Cudoniella acicularis]